MAGTEHELIAGCQSGDRRASAELVRRYQGELGRVVYRLVGSRSITEEIVQETFLRAFERIDRIDPERGVRNWLYRVAINFARMHGRVTARIETVSDAAEESELLFVPPPDDPERRVLDTEERRRLEQALRGLDSRHREVLVLHYMEGLPFTEIAGILRRPVMAIRMRAVRARRRLQAALSEGGVL